MNWPPRHARPTADRGDGESVNAHPSQEFRFPLPHPFSAAMLFFDVGNQPNVLSSSSFAAFPTGGNMNSPSLQACRVAQTGRGRSRSVTLNSWKTAPGFTRRISCQFARPFQAIHGTDAELLLAEFIIAAQPELWHAPPARVHRRAQLQESLSANSKPK